MEGRVAYLVVVAARCCSAQSPDTPSPAIIHRSEVFPHSASVHSISALALRVQGGMKEPHAQHREIMRLRRIALFSRRDDEHAGHVVAAVAVLRSGLVEEGVFEGPVRIRHGDEVAEVRLRSLQRWVHTSDSCSERRRSARCTYSPATTDQPRRGARREASAAMLAASSGLVRTLLSAFAIASGSSWSTTIPAPLESSSIA